MKLFTVSLLLLVTASVFAATTTDKIRLRDGTELEGTVGNADGTGFNLRTKFGSLHYDWNQIDLNHLRQNMPELYQFMALKTREQAAMDQIANDQQILEFLSGKFVFRTDANKNLKNYSQTLRNLQSAIDIKNIANRNKQLSQLATQNRLILISPAPGKTMLYAVRQDWQSAARLNTATARGAAPDVTLPNVPDYPGGRLVYHVEDQQSKTTLAVYRASSSPDVVKSFYAQSLPENGWKPLGGAGAYRRGELTCLVSVSAGEQTGELTITLLIRRTL